MAEKDVREKLLEDYEDVFADIVNVLAFGGQRLLDPARLREGPTVSRYKDGEADLRDQIRDVIKFDQNETMLAEILDFFAIFGKDKRFQACKPKLVEQAEKGEEIKMCIVMDYAEKQGIKQGMDLGIKQGLSQGIKEGRFLQLCDLVQSGLLTLEQAAGACQMTEKEFQKQMESGNML